MAEIGRSFARHQPDLSLRTAVGASCAKDTPKALETAIAFAVFIAVRSFHPVAT